MNNHIPKIRALHRVIEANLFHRNPEPRLSYSRLTHAIDLLSRIVSDCPEDTIERIWHIGESGMSTVPDIIVGAFWHFSEWHSGQWSDEYRALSSLGDVFSPGMFTSGPEPDTTENDVYRALDAIARKAHGMPVYRFARLYA